MKTVRPAEIGATDFGTYLQSPEQVFVAIAIQPPNDTQIVTVHRTLEGAKNRIESYPAGNQGRVETLPLLP